jgi:hypothetical protein
MINTYLSFSFSKLHLHTHTHTHIYREGGQGRVDSLITIVGKTDKGHVNFFFSPFGFLTLPGVLPLPVMFESYKSDIALPRKIFPPNCVTLKTLCVLVTD